MNTYLVTFSINDPGTPTWYEMTVSIFGMETLEQALTKAKELLKLIDQKAMPVITGIQQEGNTYAT